MSEPVRVAVVVEGPTDAIVLEAILNAMVPGREFVLQTLQPEGSAAFGTAPFGRTGAGWAGVYRWSRQAVTEGGGSASGSSVLSNHDILIVQLDADVAGETYAAGNIRDAPCDDLPCEAPCPPAHHTTDALREVILNWLGEGECPQRIVLCTPSRSIETWVLAAVCPHNNLVQRDDWECHHHPESQLGALPRARRFKKRPDDYRRKQTEIEQEWSNVSARLTEATRFEAEVLAAMPA